MKLAQVFSIYSQFKLGESATTDISQLTTDSRGAGPDSIFIAIRGNKGDGHNYIAEVCAKNVAGLVVESDQNIPASYRGSVLLVKNTREAVVRLAARFYGNPAEKLYSVGVTGTNGKTSTTYMIEAILNQFGMNTGVIGTINHHLGDKVWPSELTTPDPITLQKRLREFLALNAKAVAFEVTSHALDQGRAEGVPFEAVVFTNLTRDHLDYHKTMEEYFLAKEKLFNEIPQTYPEKTVHAIINANDDWGRRIRVAQNVHVWTYGEVKSDFQFQVLEMSFSGTRFRLSCSRGQCEILLPLAGRHNVYNAVAAIGVGITAGASLNSCKAGLENFCGIPGRLQRVQSPNTRFVFVDYAHTDDALRTVLGVLNQIRENNQAKTKIITVFGCGGDRDRGKRPLMAEAATSQSDKVFITSDNPRTEDPMAIIQDILKGVSKELMNSKVFVEVDRREAIRKAIAMALPNDVVLIAGKGHEDYQIMGDKKLAFNDLKVAGEFLNVM